MAIDYVVKDDSGFGSQLGNFAHKLEDHKVTLELTDAEVKEARTASAYYNWVQGQVLAQAERRKHWTAYRDMLRKPGAGTPPESNAPVTLEVTPPPDMVPLGVEDWFRKLVKRIKAAKNYTDAIGLDLGIVAKATAGNASAAAPKPIFSIELVAGQPLIKWTKNGMDGVEIWKDSGDGKFTQLIFDLRPNHLDTSELPATGSSALWKYKLIYRYKDERVGEWSDEASISVKGMV